MAHKANQFIFSLLLLGLPLFKLKWYGTWFARIPQQWLWVSGVILLFALSQKNIWIKLFLVYSLGLGIYYDFIVGNRIIDANKTIVIRDFTLNKTLFTLLILCAAIWLMNFVQKMNIDWLKVCILYSSLLVLWFWIINDFCLKNNLGQIIVKENTWIPGAFLAFAIPYVLSMSQNRWLNNIAASILLTGVVWTKSSMAVLAAYIGIIFYLIGKKYFKSLIALFLITIFGSLLSMSFGQRNWNKVYADFVKCDFRKEIWVKSINFKKEENRRPTIKRTQLDCLLGTGLRTYASYGFLEGVDTITTHPHNEFLEVWCEMGYIGLVILIGFIFGLYCAKCPVEYKAALTAILIHCVGYYAARMAMTGLLIIITIGCIEKYRNAFYFKR